MQQLITMAVQQGKATLLEVANTIDSDSMSYTKSKLEEGERISTEREQASIKAQQENTQAQIAAQEKKDALDRAQQLQIARESNEKDILIKKIDVGAGGVGLNEELDAIELAGKQTIEQQKLELDRRKEANRAAEADRELDIKQQVANKPTPKSSAK